MMLDDFGGKRYALPGSPPKKIGWRLEFRIPNSEFRIPDFVI
jgi:hypothetical protein